MNSEETDEFFCNWLVRLLSDGVPLERVDGKQVQLLTEQYRAERAKRLERENARLLERIEAKKKELESLGLGCED